MRNAVTAVGVIALVSASLVIGSLVSGAAMAGDAVVVDAAARASGGSWRFDVTLAHPDSGWEHYADKWDVVAPDGALLGTRVLLHPHVSEQPFTRSLTGVAVPAGIDRVMIRAHDNVDGYGDSDYELALPRPGS